MLLDKIAVLSPDGIQRDQYVGIEGDLIAYIGNEKPSQDFGNVYNGRDKLLLPGFVNAHSHTPMTLMRGFGESLPLDQWLQRRIFPFEALMTGRDIYWATLLGIAEMVRYGITSTTDMYCKLDDMARAFAESGAKTNLSNGVTNFDSTPYAENKATKEAHQAIRDWQGAENGRIRIDLSIHAEYTSDEKTVRALAEDAKALGCRIHVHASETRKEHEECKARRNGRTPVRYFADCGAFDVRATAAHCVWIEDGDRDILREKGVTAATCPKSNLKLGSGIFDAKRALEKGVAFAIGTDGVASNNNLNMIEELRTFLLAQKGFSMDPTLISPKEAFEAATHAGALAQGRSDCGEIREGFKADLTVLDMSSPGAQPIHDLINNAAYTSSGSDIVMTLCDGKVLYQHGEYPTMDVERVIWEVEASRLRILGGLKSDTGR